MISCVKVFGSLTAAHDSQRMARSLLNLRAMAKVTAEARPVKARYAKSIRLRNSRTCVIAGLFYETRERLESFFLLEATDIEQAV